MLVVLLATAWAGYGDAEEGRPSHAEREVHFWTNAVRVDPAAFKDEVVDRSGKSCWDEFKPAEKQAMAPLALHPGLAEIARLHSADMRSHNTLSHDSTDGTPMERRLAPYYKGAYIGENVAAGHPDAYAVLFEDGWMCSSGHRSNILLADFEDFGVGADGVWWTQDFGSRGRGVRPMNMGIHLPRKPRGSATFAVDVVGSPGAVDVVVDGQRHALAVEYGEPDQGIWSVQLDGLADGCHTYWFEAVIDGAAVTWPEEGGYGFGGCSFDDAEAEWLAASSLPGGRGAPGAVDDGDPADPDPGVSLGEAAGGCCDAPEGDGVPLGSVAGMFLLGAAGRRRRQA
ncbi:MAG: CAP domain-containing protein [Alphaproteobacteria bacterium]|nr:CAP domain-containing protein [Alphaproteobacteria bacterium]